MVNRSEPGTTLVWPTDVKTLAIDIGGTGLKASVLDSHGVMITDRVKLPTPYPCPPPALVSRLLQLTSELPEHHRVSVGFPGLVRHGRVVEVPSLSRDVPGGPPNPQTVSRWHNFDLASALAQAFALPVKVANDADVQGCAVVSGDGLEFVMTLGTGVGTALFYNGKLLPHLELSHAPFRDGETYDILLGEAQRKKIGKRAWITRILEAIPLFEAFLFFDHIYIGGGNARHLVGQELGPKATIVPNTAGILGGIRIWELDN